MRQGLFFILIWLMAYSCTKPTVEIPKDILHKEEMIAVLADVHIAQAAAAMYQTSDSTRYSLPDLMKSVLKIHHITQAQYDSSVVFYSKHPEVMEVIYDSVITVLSRKQSETESSTTKPANYGR
jgi:hypothetical protein